MLKEAMKANIKALEQKLIKGMSPDEAKNEVSNLLTSLDMVIDDEKRLTFHALANSVQKVISPNNIK